MHSSSTSEAASAWQFVKRADRIWIVRPGELTITVRGPRLSRIHYRFHNEDSVQDFQVALAERLASEGWLLCPWSPSRAHATRRHTSPSWAW